MTSKTKRASGKDALPFLPIREHLYTAEELLLNAFKPAKPASLMRSMDLSVYRYFVRTGRGEPRSHFTSMMESLHDNSMSHARHASFGARERLVGIMGGHDLKRTSTWYRRITTLGRSLTREGFVVVSGGGPGAMEAAHLGAALASAGDEELSVALRTLRPQAKLPKKLEDLIDHRGRINRRVLSSLHKWWAPAVDIARTHQAMKGRSLAFPTWYYGHEPFTPFASSIAKYFQNSIREDGLIAISNAGVIFAEGSAGTLQEIFQDAAFNYYAQRRKVRPMVFLGKSHWTKKLPAVKLLRTLFSRGKHRLRLCVTDDPDEVVSFLVGESPR